MHTKTGRILQVICIAFCVIAARVLHLGLQKDNQLKEAEKPKSRTVLLRAERGEIYDRFHIPLASNRICYNAAVYYSQIHQIPSRAWKWDAQGNRVRTFPRKEYIQNLSLLLSDLLDIEPVRIEDLIYSKASLLPHVPFILKTHLDEQKYYTLKMLEKDWPGLHAEIGSERHYPQGKTACHIIGTLGSIDQKQYTATAQEIQRLQELIEECDTKDPLAYFTEGYDSIEEVWERLEQLKNKAYALSDKIGKSGIEAQFEEELRGTLGLKTIEIDNQGKPLQEKIHREPIPGSQITLSISSELQQFAEELLIRNDKDRDGKSFGIDPLDRMRKMQKQPWIKGGAIVALDPKTGEVITLASHPRFDPNDFIRHESHRWLENEKMHGAIWDGKQSLMRERFSLLLKKPIVEKTILTWDEYLLRILPGEGPIRAFFEKHSDVKSAVQMQEDFQDLLYFAKNAKETSPLLLMEAITNKNSSLWELLQKTEEALPRIRRLDLAFQGISSPKDRVFLIDLCRLAVSASKFSDELLLKIGSLPLKTYRAMNQAFCRFEQEQKENAFTYFHKNVFPLWKQENQKKFLTEKRKKEKEQKTYARPYIDYLDKKEKDLFAQYWIQEKRKILLENLESSDKNQDGQLLKEHCSSLPAHLKEEYLCTFSSFEELDEPLFFSTSKYKTLKDLAALFYPSSHFGFLRSYAFQTPMPQGSIFKLITAFEGLRQGHHFSILDEQGMDPNKNLIVAYSTDKTPYHRLYKGGRLPKSHAQNIGKIDIVGALEQSSNPYFAILAGDYLHSPEDLNRAASLFGYGKLSGIDLPGEAPGLLPSDLATNKSSLYSYSIGQHTLLATPLQTATACACLANGGELLKPQIVKQILSASDAFEKRIIPPFVRASGFLPASARNLILEGMDRCSWSEKGRARPSAIRSLLANPALMRDYVSLQHQMIGKTGTAEILHNPAKNPSSAAQIYKYIWFGAIAFSPDNGKAKWEDPELVIAVVLPFGDGGKEAAPLAAQLLLKWRELKKKYKV